jgi:hypothetical protein
VSRLSRALGQRLRILADALDPQPWPEVSAWSVTFERFEGFKVNSYKRGCPLWWYSSDIGRAYTEAFRPDPIAAEPYRNQD